MRKGICILICLLPILAQKKDEGNVIDKGIDWAIGLWKRAEKEGRPFAEKTIKQAPAYYKGIQKSLTDFAKRVERGDVAKSIEEKKKLVTELWHMRSAINLMSLLEPAVLKQLTGFDTKQFGEMQKTLQKTESKLAKAGVKAKA
ncbi:MAG: hypothetical protein QE269_11715 [Fimbriimonas sp.]|nr:hypothetical protein [Fimbriimonas sp.]